MNIEETRKYHREYQRKYRKEHPEVNQAACRKWRKNNKETYVASVARWNDANPEKRREYGRRADLKSRYGLTPERYDEILEEQNHTCLICKTSLKDAGQIDVDHCHKTKKVRGILHTRCNNLLGCAKDDETILFSAIEYLRESKKQ